PLKSHKGINLSLSSISTPALTDKDKEDLEFGLSQDVDYIALSFVREAADLEQVRELVKRSGKRTHVIAKVERHEAVEAMESVVAASDAVMVARGDLGVEMLLEQVPAKSPLFTLMGLRNTVSQIPSLMPLVNWHRTLRQKRSSASQRTVSRPEFSPSTVSQFR
ncbi:pyruvate kinase, partial [Trichocoleus sp. ST-U3]